MVKHWCEDAGLQGQYDSHTLRKTWGYHQSKTFGTPTALLTKAYGYASERQTLDTSASSQRKLMSFMDGFCELGQLIGKIIQT